MALVRVCWSFRGCQLVSDLSDGVGQIHFFDVGVISQISKFSPSFVLLVRLASVFQCFLEAMEKSYNEIHVSFCGEISSFLFQSGNVQSYYRMTRAGPT